MQSQKEHPFGRIAQSKGMFHPRPYILSQVRVRKLEGLDELSWGELEGEDSKLEPFKGRLAALKEAWDEGVLDRWVVCPPHLPLATSGCSWSGSAVGTRP